MERIHRFLRLKRNLPWLPEELDGFIASSGGRLDGDTLANAARAVLLKDRFKAKAFELCGLVGDIPSFPIDRKKKPDDTERTPYDVLFNVPDLMHEDKSYPAASVRYNAKETSSVAQERTMRLRAGLRVDEGELKSLIEGLWEAFVQSLSFDGKASLARCFQLRLRGLPQPALPPRVLAKLARPLQVMVSCEGSFPLSAHNLSLLFRHAVLARWLKLSITDLLTLIRLAPGVGKYVSGLSDALAVVRFYDWWKSTRLSLADLSLILAPVDSIKDQIDDLWEALQAWLQDQESVTLTDTFLTQVEGVNEALSQTIVKINMGKVFETAGSQIRIIATSQPNDLDLTPLANLKVDQDAIRTLIRGYHPDERLPRAIAEALKTDIELARAVVVAALASHSGLSASQFLQKGAMPESLRPPLVNILRLHRIGSALHITPPTLSFITGHQAEFGVTDWGGPNHDALRRIAAIQNLIKKNFRETPDPAHAQIKRLFADSKVLAEVAIVLFSLDPTLVTDVVGTIPMPLNTIDALLKVERCVNAAQKLSIDSTALKGIVSDDYAQASVSSAAVLAGFRAKYADEATWMDKIQPYQDQLLEKKRDALIDYLMHGPDAQFPDAKEMYKYFLIDAEVDGCFRTSRIVAACSSLQLYVHRILTNLEKEPNNGLHVQPSLIPDEEWEWRQHYRVWEANRKIFLWPENYLDPTIRDDKTPLFKELESELLQQEISEQTVIDAYSNYLNGLGELANLRFAGAYHHYIDTKNVNSENDSDEVMDIFYLFGATGGDAPTHYWREIRNLAHSQSNSQVSPEFGPWRKVDTRIPVRHVSPVVFNQQLLVFWNEITTTSQNAVDDGKSRFIGYSHRYSLKFTSLRMDGQWTPPETVSLRGASPTFKETDNSVDDPLVENAEMQRFIDAFFSKFCPWFGTYGDPSLNYDETLRDLLIPRWAPSMRPKMSEYGDEDNLHTKAQEGYTLSGFMWERPYLTADPSFEDCLLVDCAGLMVRGLIDLFGRQVIKGGDTSYLKSQSVGSELLSYRNVNVTNFDLLRRDSTALWTTTWEACPFDYPVAASLALNASNLDIFSRHLSEEWKDQPAWSSDANLIANVSADAGTWAVAGSPRETIIETENDLFLLLPAGETNKFMLHRLGTTLVKDVARKLFENGVDGLLAIDHQLGLSEPAPEVKGGLTADATVSNPIANDAAYGVYYQEIFQHIPLLIAYYLNARGKFEQAQRWYHYVFDPTSPETPTDRDAPTTDRNWKYRQFRGHEQEKLRNVLCDTVAIKKYNDDPFNAHAIARLRVSAYQKAVVMGYIDNLLDWGDDLFTRFQMETVNQAMMLYVTAAEILGPRPLQTGECGANGNHARTYESLKDAFSKDSEFLLEVEQLIPQPPTVTSQPGEIGPIKPVFGFMGLLSFPVTKTPAVASPVGASVSPRNNPTPTSVPRSLPMTTSDTRTSTSVAKNLAHSYGVNATRTGPQVKIAVALPLTEERVKSFAVRQQFTFLGSQWKDKGGIVVPSTLGSRFGRAMVRQISAAFCIPRNEILQGYWERVEDRVWKIRTCRDITGLKRKLSLFAPPIDPALLARARAAGISLDDALGAFDGMIPQYRFSYLLQKAKEYAGTVQSFGAALQSALERKDSEELVKLQTTQQQQILALTTKAKEWELNSAAANLESNEKRKIAIENRRAHYDALIAAGLNDWERKEADATHTTSILNGTAATLELLSGVLHLIPQLGSPFSMKYGGLETGTAMERIHGAMGMLARVSQAVAASASLEARNDRRREDWTFQRDQANDELAQVEKQIEAAQIACDLAEHSITLHEKNIEHNDELLEYHEEKFSGLGLYTWLASQLQRTYREAYNMAFRMARIAEQAYRFEREDYTSGLLSGQYWDAPHAGLLAGNRLTLDLQQLDQRYIETDIPKREITDHCFSLRQWDPKALIALRQKSECEFNVPELFFDLASPGDYRRRLRSVRVTIPAVAGPFTNIMATLSLERSQMRYEPNLNLPSEDLPDAPRPRVNSITTSSARNDAGAFELNFRGEKYVPFEGAGAVSKWSLSLPKTVRMFDYDTISDIVLHLDYTASLDGVFRGAVQDVSSGILAQLQSDGIIRALSFREEFPSLYQRMIAGESVDVEITRDYLPFFLQSATVKDATLVFTGNPEEAPTIGSVEFNGKPPVEPTMDDHVGGMSMQLTITGTAPWEFTIRVTGMSSETKAYLILHLISN